MHSDITVNFFIYETPSRSQLHHLFVFFFFFFFRIKSMVPSIHISFILLVHVFSTCKMFTAIISTSSLFWTLCVCVWKKNLNIQVLWLGFHQTHTNATTEPASQPYISEHQSHYFAPSALNTPCLRCWRIKKLLSVVGNGHVRLREARLKYEGYSQHPFN